MRWRAELGGCFLVTRDGEDLGAPPSRTVGVLLIGLLSRLGTWSGRSEIARRLYPDSDVEVARAALRQALSRLRAWVGEQAIGSDADRIRLADAWELSLDRASRTPASYTQIAPGLEHSWLNEIRLDWRPPAPSAEPSVQAFAQTVEAAALLDPSAGRALLIGGQSLLSSLPPAKVLHLLALTQPRNRSDSQAIEHLELQAFIECLACAWSPAAARFRTAYRLAVEQRRDGDGERIAAFAAFSAMESGNIATAGDWISRLGASAKNELLVANARAAYEWNRNRPREGLAIMDSASRLIASGERPQKVHFWSNYACLAADIGEVELSEDAEARCLEASVPLFDGFWMSLYLARALRFVARRQLAEALSSLEQNTHLAHWTMRALYQEEALALARAEGGDASGARRAWSNVRAIRAGGKGTLNPRVKARERRIPGLFVTSAVVLAAKGLGPSEVVLVDVRLVERHQRHRHDDVVLSVAPVTQFAGRKLGSLPGFTLPALT